MMHTGRSRLLRPAASLSLLVVLTVACGTGVHTSEVSALTPTGAAAASARTPSSHVIESPPALSVAPAPIAATAYRTTQNLDLALGEGILLTQRVVLVRLPPTLQPTSPPFLSAHPATWATLSTVLHATASAPPLSAAWLHLPRSKNPSGLPQLPNGVAFPVTAKTSGYALTLSWAQTPPPFFHYPVVPSRQLSGQTLSFIGEPTTQVTLPPSISSIALGSGLTGHWYVIGPNTSLSPGTTIAAATLLTWQEGRDTYAIYNTGYLPTLAVTVQKQIMASLARTMSRTVIAEVAPLTRQFRYFDDLQWTHPELWQTTVQVAPSGARGFALKNHEGYRVQVVRTAISTSKPPPWPAPGPTDPTPVLRQVIPVLASVRIPVLLPADVPLPPSRWPRLTVNADAQGYNLEIETTPVNLAPNTPYAVSLGLASLLGTVQASTSSLNNAWGVTMNSNAPLVPARDVTPTVLSQYARDGSYRGPVVLSNGVRALLEVQLAGDGNHAWVIFQQGGVYYSVGNYHSVRSALAMAASMVPIPP
jgi:hypothetical protein